MDAWAHIPARLRIRYDEECVSIPNTVRMSAAKFAGLEALVDDEVRLTFAELESAMIDSVRAMIALGVGPGTRVALWAPNSARWILAALGIQGAGGIVVPINTRFKGEEGAYLLDRSGATALVTVKDFLDTDYPTMVRSVAPDAPALARAVVASGEAGPGELSWEQFLHAGKSVSVADAHAAIDAVTPDALSDILSAGSRGDHDLSSLRVAMASAASVPPALVSRIREELGIEVMINCYGLTEATSLATTTIPGRDDWADVVGTIGRAARDVELAVVDDVGEPTPAGTPGELWIRGYNVMQGYWDDPAETSATITAEGWLRTGDIVVMDERGFDRIVDRRKDVVIVGGFNVYPAEVERILLTHPKIADAAVVGLPDHRMGEVPVAFVVPSREAQVSSDAIIAWASEKIANVKVPRRIFVVDGLPRNASMKVLKNQLRERAVASTVPGSLPR